MEKVTRMRKNKAAKYTNNYRIPDIVVVPSKAAEIGSRLAIKGNEHDASAASCKPGIARTHGIPGMPGASRSSGMPNMQGILRTSGSSGIPISIMPAILAAVIFVAFIFPTALPVFAAPKDSDLTVQESQEPSGVRGGAVEVTDFILSAVVSKDHSYEVEEKIKVNIPDSLQRIDFEIPSGNFRITDLTVEDTAYTSKNASESSIVSIVDPAKLETGSHEYTIRYTIREYQDRDESKDMFYFNVLPPSWKQPIGNVNIKVEFPSDFPWDDMQCYAGQFGVQDSTNRISFEADEISKTVTVTGRLVPENFGITLKAQLPEPYWEDALNGSWAYRAAIASIAVACLLLLILWFIGGRDPKVAKEKVTRPLEGFNPVELGYVFNSKVSVRDVIHLILYFAEKGYLRISEYEPKRYRLYKVQDPAGEEKMYRSAYSTLFEGVFTGRALEMEELGPRLEQIRRSITDDVAAGFATSEQSAFTPISKAFRAAGAAVLGAGLGLAAAFSYIYNYLSVNYVSCVLAGIAAAAAALILCLQVDTRDSSDIGHSRMAEILSGALAAAPVLYAAVTIFRNTGDLFLPAVVIVLAAISIFLIVIMRARGSVNAGIVARLRSLRNFIYHPTPKELLENHIADPRYYYDMLIYALAFRAEESWAISFLTLNVPEPEWYSDDIEGHAFTNLRAELSTIDYARDIRSFERTLETAYDGMSRRRSRS